MYTYCFIILFVIYCSIFLKIHPTVYANETLAPLSTNLCTVTDRCTEGVKQTLFTGQAYDLKSGKRIYSEHHAVLIDKQGDYLYAEVKYLNNIGEVIAHKTVDFKWSETIPTIDLYEYGVNNRTTVTPTALSNPQSVSLKIEHFDHPSDQIKSTNRVNVNDIPLKQIVVDYGFDRFIVNNWSSLLAGDALPLSFLSIDRETIINFTIKKSRQSKESVLFLIKPDNLLIRLLMKPIKLTYHIEHKTLIEFQGITNLKNPLDPHQDNHKARIAYRYDH